MPLCSGRDNKSDNKIASIIRTMENKLLYHSKLGTLVMNKRIPHAVWQGEEMCSLVYHHVKDSTNDNGNDNEYSEPLKQ